MPRLTALLLAIPTTAFFYGVSAYGHNCGHHGGCASSYDRDHGCYGCGPGNLGSRWSNAPATPSDRQPRSRPARVHNREGKIAEVIYLPGAAPERAMVELRLADGTTDVLVRLGPAGFLKQNQLNLREGDAISVRGYLVSAGADDLLVATEVTREGKTVRFRDEWGRSEW